MVILLLRCSSSFFPSGYTCCQALFSVQGFFCSWARAWSCITTSKVCASNASVMKRYQALHVHTSDFPRPTSPFPCSKPSSTGKTRPGDPHQHGERSRGGTPSSVVRSLAVVGEVASHQQPRCPSLVPLSLIGQSQPGPLVEPWSLTALSR